MILEKKKEKWYWVGFVAAVSVSFRVCHLLTLSCQLLTSRIKGPAD